MAEYLFRVSRGQELDAQMVHEYIMAMGLNPRPDIAREPLVLRDVALTLLVETYDWGRVCAATRRGTGEVVTWLEHGEIPEIPEWCAYIRHKFDAPECVGHYALGDQECDGIDGVEPPCIWRSRCKAVKARAPSGDPDDVADVIASMAMSLSDIEPPEKHQRGSPIPNPKYKPRARRKPMSVAAAPKRRRPVRRGAKPDPYHFHISRRWAFDVIKTFTSRIGMEYHRNDEASAHIGEFFHRDVTAKSSHLTLYIRTGKHGAPRAVAYLYLGKRNPQVKVALIGVGDDGMSVLRDSLPRSMDLKQWKDGPSTQTVIIVDQEDQCAAAAAALTALHSAGLYRRTDPGWEV